MTDPVRVRPLKQFRVIIAHGPYQVGAIIQPVGMYRAALLAKQIIEPVEDPPRGLDAVDNDVLRELNGEDDGPETTDRMLAPQFRRNGRGRR